MNRPSSAYSRMAGGSRGWAAVAPSELMSTVPLRVRAIPSGSSAEGAPAGAYRHLLGGHRFSAGQLPKDPLPWFKEGITGPESG